MTKLNRPPDAGTWIPPLPGTTKLTCNVWQQAVRQPRGGRTCANCLAKHRPG